MVSATSQLIFLLLTISPALSDNGFSCDWECSPIKSCSLVFNDLIRAKNARQEQNNQLLSKVIGRIRSYLCDSQAETVCCPRVLGSLVTPRGAEHTVYAVTSERLGLRTAAGDRESWEQAEVFFWTQENCFPGIEYRDNNVLEDLDADVSDDEAEEVIFSLPPGLSVSDAKCLSAWSQNEELGFAHLTWRENK